MTVMRDLAMVTKSMSSLGQQACKAQCAHPLVDGGLTAYLDVPVHFARGYGHGYVE